MKYNTNKIAVVSGGAGGIGQTVVMQLAQADFLPVILDHNEEDGQQVLALLEREGKEGTFFGLDVTKRTEVQHAFTKVASTYDRIDVLVNLAGGSLYNHSIEDFPFSEWREVINVNLKATFLCCQAAVAVMKKRKKGAIVNTSSNFAFTGSISRSAYSASKAAVIAFTKSLAVEVAPFGIRANVIAPGLTATQKVFANYSSEDWALLERTIPLGRTGKNKGCGRGCSFFGR